MNEEREQNAHKNSNVIAKVLCMQVNTIPKINYGHVPYKAPCLFIILV